LYFIQTIKLSRVKLMLLELAFNMAD